MTPLENLMVGIAVLLVPCAIAIAVDVVFGKLGHTLGGNDDDFWW